VLRRFILAQGDHRPEPASADVDTPNVLREPLVSNAEDWHANHDSLWVPPPGVQVISVVGWGIPTLRGLRYTESHGHLDPQPLGLGDTTMVEGDGTVVYSSAAAAGGTLYWFNIHDYNTVPFQGRNISHGFIFEADMVRTLLKNIVTGVNTSLPQFVSFTKPTATNSQSLNIGVHSPVTLNIFDSAGHHTGSIPNTTPDSDLNLFEEQIPNSYYWQIGEGQYAGTDASAPMTIVLKGTGTGTFDIDLHQVVGNTSSTTIFSDIPVTASTTASLSNVGLGSVSPLAVDINGDGITDAIISAGNGITVNELVGLLQGLADSLNLPFKKDKKLDKKIAQLQKVLDKEYKNESKQKQKLSLLVTNLESRITTWQKKGLLTSEDAGALVSLLEQIRNSLH
jgi:hypothetical protein